MLKKYLKYQVEDWVTDDDFIHFIHEGGDEMGSILNDISMDPKMASYINEAKKLILGLDQTSVLIEDSKLDDIFNRINATIDKNQNLKFTESKRPALKIAIWTIGIAASITLLLMFNPFSNAGNQIISTQIAEHQTIALPDESLVELNNVSTLSFDSKNWNKKRNVRLNGEAFFKVAKGSKFIVQSPQGKVSVLGTQFNIYDRDGYYEVECLEGKVQVDLKDGTTYVLLAGDKLSSKQGTPVNLEKKKVEKIDWLNNYVDIKEMPLSKVLEEVSRYYDVEFENVETIKLKPYTGFFTTKSLDSAIYQILWPLDISYIIEENKVIIK